MIEEFKKIKSNGETRFVLEFSDAGVTGSTSIATVEKPIGELQSRTEPPKPRNFVAKNAKMGGAGQHKDKKKAAKQGDTKHKKPFAEGFNGEYDDEAGMAQSNLLTTARAVQGLLDTIKDRDNLPEWAQEKIAKAEMMLVSVWDYLQSQKEMGNDPQVDMEEARTNYHANTTGFRSGPRDDERHDLDVQQDPREFRMYNLTIDGKPLNPQPIMGRSNLIKFGKQQAAAGVDLSNAMISLVDEGLNEFAPDNGDGGEEDTLLKFARMWYNGDDITQQQVEQTLDRMGWEIGELESEEGGAFVVQSGDENGDTYIGFTADDLTEGVSEPDAYMESLAAKLAETITRQN